MILCCGEALIDMIPEPLEGGRIGFVPHSGGALFNTAIGLGRLGAEVALLTGLSTDGFGQQLETALTASKVETGYLVKSDRPSTLAVVHLQDGHAKYTFYDENSAGQAMRTARMPDLPDAIDVLFFGGISLCNGPAADAYAELAERESRSRMIMIDPNIRPGFAEDEPRYRARLDRMLAKADIIKISDEDLDWLRPGPKELMQKVQDLLENGTKMVLLTQGAQGATALTRSGLKVSAPVNKVEVVDTVGAGDTFNAGIMTRLQELSKFSPDALDNITEAELTEMLTFANKAAAITVSRAGANPPWRTELS